MNEMNNNLDEKNLKVAYFLETKRRYFKKALIIFLILFNLAAYPFLIYYYTSYFAKSKEIDTIIEELNQRNIEFDVVNKINSPLALEVSMAGVVPIADGRYNLICRVENPNRKWFVQSLKYKFVSAAGFATKEYEGYILPEEDKLLVDFNEKIGSLIDQISCEVTQIKWQKTKVDNYKFLSIPQDFNFQDVQYLVGADGSGATSQFTFINSTVYDLRDINLLVFLYEGNEIVGVDKTYVDEVRSNERKELKIIWPEAIPFVSRTIIKPEIKIFDSSTYVELPIIPSER